ncbi:membrane-bound PQQ-dependent dehydrogenase, glucose/quinate/shikimate family [Caenibius tardaugens]|uniref:membrane-bound PQQ-dependent dehydrogenase, glucose/quinate/shikimate family n=1 Tax=Caenibius tardaugens TaxID=169176 RepID=UPI0004245FAF|nr:membrane-bound PQQ-dependent dehydrogenase, glucose/quinate/shikimate family [Caenibius tardaugens]AZI35146.1 membrane-bound PQQ-dependent dehydrogenase, glucose/quinate/shikimate family [Caenibius tardaugens NBRC 16725]
MRRLVLWPLGGLLAIIGILLAWGGAMLASLGGSLYYLPAGLACLAAGVLIARGHKAGFWLYCAVFAATVIWALAEVGLHFWLLLPRIAGPLVILLYLLAPWVRRHLRLIAAPRAVDHNTPPRTGPRTVMAVIACIALAWAAGFAMYDRNGAARAAQATGDQTATRWADYAGNKAGTRFSPASQITPANVADLEVAWQFRTGDMPNGPAPQMFQATPLQIGDTLYLCTPHNIVIALDADTGKQRWRYDPAVDATGVYTVACRGVSYHESADAAARAGETPCARRVLVATIDGRMIAVDAADGKPCPDFGTGGQVSLREGLGPVKGGIQFTTSPATIIGNTAVVGSFVLDNMGTDNPSGVVRAFDVVTGRQIWAWDAGRHDPSAPLQPGESFTPGSPNAWSLFSADEALGLVYIPTGNPSPDHFGGQRNADMERYGSSVVALDVANGKVRWAFQTVHHDLWDYDVASQPVLANVPVKGALVPALIQPTKQGEIFLLDRRTGKPLAPVENVPVPQGDLPGERYAPTQPVSHAFASLVPPVMRESDMWGATPLDQMWCRIAFRKMRYEGRYTPPSLDESLIFPGNNGIMNWGSAAVDEARGVMVVPTSYMPLKLRMILRKDAPQTGDIAIEGNGAVSPMRGTPYAVRTERPFVSPLGIPCNAPPWGRLTAIDLKTRQILWQRPLGTTADHAPLGIAVPGVFNQGGAMVTGGGLAFIGATMDNYLRAFDLKNGKELWKGRLPAGGQALPMSYVSPRTGRQYVVIAAGGHAFMKTTPGDYVVAYSLKGDRAPH